MKMCQHCRSDAEDSNPVNHGTFQSSGTNCGQRMISRLRSFVQWSVPTSILILMPKCPMCVAAYVALGTGIGLSIPAAAAVRVTLIVLSAGALAFLIARQGRKLFALKTAKIGK